jgi:hypothetical protein
MSLLELRLHCHFDLLEVVAEQDRGTHTVKTYVCHEFLVVTDVLAYFNLDSWLPVNSATGNGGTFLPWRSRTASQIAFSLEHG